MMIFDDEMHSVEDTAFDSANGKWSSSSLGYYKDKYIGYFIDMKKKLLPHQNLGYYIRHSIYKKALIRFYEMYGKESQIVVIGCGFDTSYWLMKSENIIFQKWFDLDKERIIEHKKKIIYDVKPNIFLPAENYYLHSFDFDATEDFLSKLKEFRKDLPTLFIDEFSMIYLKKKTTKKMLSLISSLLNSSILSFGMVGGDDEFGLSVKRMFKSYGFPLKSYELTLTIMNTINLFVNNGFKHVITVNNENILKKFYEQKELQRVISLGNIDEEELSFLFSHYSTTVAGHENFISFLQIE